MADVYTVTALSPMRKIIASRMAEAKREIPHFRLSAEVRAGALLELRLQLRASGTDVNVTLNDLLITACAAALKDAPGINIQWVGNEIRQYETADIAVVVALKGGLSTPIIRRAESKSIWEISREFRALAARADANLLKMDEIIGGTFSMSNLGMYDVDDFDAIINPPQCAILAVGAIKPRPVVSPEREVVVADVLRLTLSMDHRAIDGVTGATFLSALRERLEHPDFMLTKGSL